MTDQIPMRSASERRDAARPVLMWLGVYADRAREIIVDIDGSREAESMDDVFAVRDDADDHLSHYVQHIEKQRAVLEALLEAPEVGVTEDEIVDGLLVEHDVVGERLESGEVRALLIEAVRRAERAALEHWEPADVPSQEFMLRHLGITHRESVHADGTLYIPEQYIEKEVM